MTDTLIVDGHTAWLCRVDLDHKTYYAWPLQAPQAPQTLRIERKLVDQLPAGVLAGMPAATIAGAGSRQTVTLQTKGGSWQLPAEGTRDLAPPTPPADGVWHAGATLQGIWGPLLPAMSTDYSRRGICAMEISSAAGTAHAATTDGYRLAYWHGTADLPDGTWHWPAAAVRWLERQRNWTWRAGADIWVRGPGSAWLLQATPVPGFPDYRVYIIANLNSTTTCTLPAKQLAAAIKDCTVGTAPKRLRLAWGDGTLRLTGNGRDGTGAAATLEAATEGNGMALLDPMLLRPLVAGFGKQTITLHSQGDSKPLYIRAGNWLALQMICRE